MNIALRVSKMQNTPEALCRFHDAGEPFCAAKTKNISRANSKLRRVCALNMQAGIRGQA